ncbi:hypothetical protein DESC_580017 [Desulfosarcina cetonica]|nr:hypothetical protein DESC_580017 [Desulfosarcina cetonica]
MTGRNYHAWVGGWLSGGRAARLFGLGDLGMIQVHDAKFSGLSQIGEGGAPELTDFSVWWVIEIFYP